MEEYRLPKAQAKRTALVETIGADGYALLNAIYTTPELNWLEHVPAVEILRRVWVQQFELIDGKPHFRTNDNIPPPPKMIGSPYDADVTYGRKLTTWWVGYKVHLTDTNYAEAKQFVQSRQQYGIDLIAPTRADHKWQTKEQHGFDAASFPVDWDAQQVRFPAGRASSSWTPTIDRYGKQVIRIKFSLKDCRPCPLKAHSPRPHVGRFLSVSRNTIKPFSPSEHVKRTRNSGKNIAVDQGSRAPSHKECEPLACVAVGIGGWTKLICSTWSAPRSSTWCVPSTGWTASRLLRRAPRNSRH